ncbi:MAG: two-component sensor histidine kinase [Alphaproteobacteria bacterium CG_4_9_14_3_um_filter_47_13]|nr:MAG: two-component sensor histidine kinase [Alphaproteobacteria bacterium CG_4_9_14_3_um_filter_47_13]
MKSSLKKFLPRTLFGRSLLILATPVILVQMVTMFVFFDSHWGKMTARLAFGVAGEIAVIADQIEKDLEPASIRSVAGWAGQNLELLISYEPDSILEVKHDAHYRALRHYEIEHMMSRALEAQVRRPYRVYPDVLEKKWVEVTIQLEKGLLRVSIPERRLFSTSVYLFLRWMIASSIILLIVAVLFMRNQIRPIRRLAIAAERFGKGKDIPASFKPEGAREVRQAAHAFLKMQERIKRQIQQRTAMLSGVSHDLRTPLTRMKLQVAMLEDCPDIEGLKQDILAMERMIDAYLDFVRGEGGEQTMRIDLKDILIRIVSDMARQNCEVDLEIEGDLSLQLRPVAFERCLTNIVSNAQKYGGKIWIKSRRLEDSIEIIVDDNGTGIPENKREDVFKPFYRLEDSRNPETGGIGLGLPIAQDIIHSHGGEISLSQNEQGGLRVTILIPV